MNRIVCFSRDGLRYTAEADRGETLLDALLFQGHDIPYCCTVGICGMCKAEVNYGEVAMDSPTLEGLSSDDRLHGRVLMCRATALSNCTLTLVHQHIARGADSATAMVTQIERIDDRWIMCQLRVGKKAANFDFRPGQHLWLELTGVAQKGRSVGRAYAGSRTDEVLIDFYLDLQVCADDEATALCVGTTLIMQSPSGIAATDLGMRGPAILIGAGGGVVPWASAWHQLNGRSDQDDVWPFVMAAGQDRLTMTVLSRTIANWTRLETVDDVNQLLKRIGDRIETLTVAGVSPKQIRAFVYAPQEHTARVRKHLLEHGLAPWKITVDAVRG